MGNLTDLFDQSCYQSDVEWHDGKELRKQLEKLEQLHPGTPCKMNPLYWRLRGDILKCIALNSIEQFLRGKDAAGMLTEHYFTNFIHELESKEEKSGFEAQYF